MERMVGRHQPNSQITMHFHKQMLLGMVMVQQILQDMPTIKPKLHLPHTTRANNDTNLTHDSSIVMSS